MRKIKNLIIPITLFIGFFLYDENVSAITYESLTVEPQENVYYVMTNNEGYFSADPFSYYAMNGKAVFCIEQGVKLDTHSYIGEEGYVNSPFNFDTNRRIELIGHYGYDYPGHQTLKYRMATQALIWETITGNRVDFYTENYGYGDYISVEYEREQIMNLVNKHYSKPSFNAQTFNAILNQELVIEDTNNIINEFEFYNKHDNNARIENNKLFVTPNKAGETTIQLFKSKYDNGTTFFYIANDGYSQKLAYFRASDPVYADIHLNVMGGKIKILKQDSDTKSCKSSGQTTLNGAKYGVYDFDNNLVDTLVIGNDCTAISKELSYGTYTIKEISAPVGYELDSNIYTATINSTKALEIISKENIIKGKIKILKQDSETNSCKSSGQASLIGAKYGVYDINNNLVDALVIGNDCMAISKELPYGTYTIKEISAPVGYELDPNIYTATINSTKTLEIILKENIIKGKIKILKQDSETNSCKSSGQASLIGAKYGVYDINNNLVDTLVIGTDCTAISKELPYGTYTIKELSAPVGYELDSNTYTATINSTKVLEIISKENIIKNHISILKQYDYVDCNSTLLNAEANITFEIYNQDNTLYAIIVTDKNGYASLEIPYGVWKFHQVNSNIGFEKIYDFYITVDENTEKKQYYNILNNKLSAYLKVIKVDSETGNTIAIKNTTFKILNTDTNQFVSQFVGGKVLDKFYTDENGVMMTYLKLEAGNYKLIEIDSPNGYLINSNGLDFTIGENTKYDYTNYGAIVTLYFKNNSIKGQIEINKFGERFEIENNQYIYKEIPLNNIEFNIYANEDIKSSDGNYIYFNKGDLVTTLITNENGYAVSDLLPLGKYKIKEIKTNNDYILDENEYIVELKQIDNKTEVVKYSLKMTNLLKKGKVEITKKDLVNGDVIPNTVLEIYTENNELIFTGVTNEIGKIVIDNLKIGKYYIVEKEASAGYIISNEKFYFEIKENNEIVKAEMKNRPITSSLEITKQDISSSEPLPNTTFEIYTENDELIFSGITDSDGKLIVDELRYGKYYFVEKNAPDGYILNNEKIYFEVNKEGEVIKSIVPNTKINSKIRINKVDQYGNNISNVLIGIYDLENNLIQIITTNENGYAECEIEYGQYYYQEIETIDGYILNNEKVYFSITDNEVELDYTLINEKIEIPNTLKNKSFIAEFSTFVSLILGIGMIIYAKKENL